MLDHYAVIGNPIAHSKSPYIHTQFAQQTQQSIKYDALLAPDKQFYSTLHHFIEQGGKGLNVTVPFKIKAYDIAHMLTPRAKAAGAVNTLTFSRNTIFGDNTDGVGLVTDILHNAKITLQNKTILLLGAGGAARGVLLPLLQTNPSKLVIANRSPEKAKTLAKQFSKEGNISACPFSKLNTPFDIIINATSASLHNADLAISKKIIHDTSFVYDMMYAATSTTFMQWASKHGAQTRDGLGMLVEQAAESFFIWRNVRPHTATIYQHLRKELSSS